MPELPEVEILVRHLRPLLRGKTIRRVVVRRPKTIAPDSSSAFARRLEGARFLDVCRRGKYLVFKLTREDRAFQLLGHLGMTGRMYLAKTAKAGRRIAPREGRLSVGQDALPKHCPVWFDLGAFVFIFEDYRYFGRLTLENSRISRLGVEPLSADFTTDYLAGAMEGRRQCIKTALLDQRLIAGIGNIYASEILFRARIAPGLATGRLKRAQVERLREATVEVLNEAINAGSTMALDFAGKHATDGLFYFGSVKGEGREAREVQRMNLIGGYSERLLVYDRAGEPCVACGDKIRRTVQGGRSSFHCPGCQRHRVGRKSKRAAVVGHESLAR